MNTFNINTQRKDKRNFTIKKIPFPYLKLLNFLQVAREQGKPFSYGHFENYYKTQYNSMRRKSLS